MRESSFLATAADVAAETLAIECDSACMYCCNHHHDCMHYLKVHKLFNRHHLSLSHSPPIFQLYHNPDSQNLLHFTIGAAIAVWLLGNSKHALIIGSHFPCFFNTIICWFRILR